jgi:hypothetical protein
MIEGKRNLMMMVSRTPYFTVRYSRILGKHFISTQPVSIKFHDHHSK